MKSIKLLLTALMFIAPCANAGLFDWCSIFKAPASAAAPAATPACVKTGAMFSTEGKIVLGLAAFQAALVGIYLGAKLASFNDHKFQHCDECDTRLLKEHLILCKNCAERAKQDAQRYVGAAVLESDVFRRTRFFEPTQGYEKTEEFIARWQEWNRKNTQITADEAAAQAAGTRATAIPEGCRGYYAFYRRAGEHTFVRSETPFVRSGDRDVIFRNHYQFCTMDAPALTKQ